MHSSDESKKPNWALRFLILSAAVCAAAAAAYFAGELADQKVNKERNNSQQATSSAENIIIDDEKEITVGGVDYKLKENIESVLIMGVDEAETQESTETYMNSDQADFLLLIVLDHEDESYRSLMINRDTMTKIPALGVAGTFAYWYEGQIALAHTFGTGTQDSCINQCWAVSELLYQVPIDHYASFAMPAIGIANDAVGGVTVTIEDDFGDNSELKQGETVKLNAQTAELFVRGRHGVADQTNINRMSRQRVFMSAWKKLAVEKMNTEEGFFFTMLGLVSDYMVSDMSVNKLSEFSNELAGYRDNGVVQIEGESRKGEAYMEFYPDEANLRETVLELFYEPSGED